MTNPKFVTTDNPNKRRRKRIVTVASILALIICCSAYLSVRAFTGGPKASSPQPKTLSAGQQAVGNPKNGPVQLIQFHVYDVGIYPREVHATKGVATSITIEDVSSGTAGVVVERVTPNGNVPAGLVQRLEQTSRGRTDFKLEPGHYQVYAQETPTTRAELIVDP